ncbi:MAG TPA: DUF4760 domain-containing protein [Anaerolineales bacterium]|nr:DUF4760 domain-containing protein [Anaerolineales bacterium]
MKNKQFKKPIIISALFFFFSLSLLILTAYIWGENDSENNIVSILESISTAIAAAAVFGAAYIAYKELAEIENTRYMEISDRLFQELNSPENIEARRHIFQKLPKTPEETTQELSKEDRDAMKRVLNSLDHVAFLTQDDWIPDKLIMPWMHPMISKSWEKLEPYVLYERKTRVEPYYYEHAGKLAERCEAWREKHLTKAQRENKWIEVDNAL